MIDPDSQLGAEAEKKYALQILKLQAVWFAPKQSILGMLAYNFAEIISKKIKSERKYIQNLKAMTNNRLFITLFNDIISITILVLNKSAHLAFNYIILNQKTKIFYFNTFS